MLDKNYTGFITRHGILHLYEDANDLREDLVKWDKDWSMIAWIEKTIIHQKGECASEAHD